MKKLLFLILLISFSLFANSKLDNNCNENNTDPATLDNYPLVQVNKAYNKQALLLKAINNSDIEILNNLFDEELISKITSKELKKTNFKMILEKNYVDNLNAQGISCDSVGARGWLLGNGKIWIQIFKGEAKIISVNE